MRELIEGSFVPILGRETLGQLDDGAVLDGSLVFTTDSYVVKPLFFPGGDIGRLAVSGTVNDIAVSGGKPLYMSFSVIVEEGFEVDELEKILASARATADEARIEIVTGDTKVAERGSADGLFINTSAIGKLIRPLSPENVSVGDMVIINGPIAEHGIAVMSMRERLGFKGELRSDVAPLSAVLEELLLSRCEIHFMRDPTRGGISACLNEVARQAEVGILIEEQSLPIGREVKSACELLGLDPLDVANEGKVLIFAPPEAVECVLSVLRSSEHGREARVIGQVVQDSQRLVILRTRIGGERIVDMPYGDELPRIC